MVIRKIPLNALVINRANDRHGELENETAAIAWLFNTRENHMRNLAKDIVNKGEIYELPLVSHDGNKFLVFDGNRRVTCLKLIHDPHRAPTAELQTYFRDQKERWSGPLPLEIQCQVEADRDRVDEILYRRHTGAQNGIGQSTWDDRMKSTFVARTGKGSGINVADEIEKHLSVAKLLPTRRKIPRSTMNRLLSAEPFRNRLGISFSKGRFEFTHNEDMVLGALARVADDLANRRIVLGDIWDVDGKRRYLDRLGQEGLLPTAEHVLAKPQQGTASGPAQREKPKARAKPSNRTTLIPQKDFGLVWPGRLQRHHQIWEELQFRLILTDHPNAISVLFRVLLELSVENYIDQAKVVIGANDKLALRMLKVADHLLGADKIDGKYLSEIKKFQHADRLISADTLHRFVHSPDFAPSPNHLTALWDALANLIVLALKA